VLVKAGANPNETGFHIWEGPNVANRQLTGSLLHFAANRDAAKLIELLYASRQLIVDSRDQDGVTPLIRVCTMSSSNPFAETFALPLSELSWGIQDRAFSPPFLLKQVLTL
jgi:hypothetical protein